MLEIGFGPGEGIAECVKLTPQGFVAGVDQSQTMLDMAQQRNHRAIMEEHVELTLGTAASLPYADESFDKLFAVNVFHFWEHPAVELAECRRVLKKGGRVAFYVTDPASYIPGMDETGIFFPRTEQEIAQLLSSAGFQNVAHREEISTDGKGFVVFGER